MAHNKQNNAKISSIPEIKVRIDRLFPGDGKTKAIASATIGGVYAIHGIRIIDKLDAEKGFFISMPQASYTKNDETKYKDVFHPITAEGRTALYDAVELAYVQNLEKLDEERQRYASEKVSEPGMGMSM